MPNENSFPPPELVLPKIPEKKPPAAWDSPLLIKYVEEEQIEIGNLIFNLVSAALMFAIMAMLIRGLLTSSLILAIAIPASVCWILIIRFRDRLWTTVDGRDAKIYLDYLFSKKLIAYIQGFHFTRWTSKQQPDVVTFFKQEVIEMRNSQKTAARFQTIDGLEMTADITIFFNRRSGQEALSKSLKYETPELRKLIQSTVVGRLAELGGCNRFESLIYYKDQAAKWLADTFGGESVLSAFEDGTGTTIWDPILDSLDLTQESQNIREVKARLQILIQGMRDLKDAKIDLTPEEMSFAAQAASGHIERVVHTYQGIPPGAKVVALGDSGVAVATGDKKRGK